MRKKHIYKLQKIRDGETWPKDSIVWALQPCKGWRVIEKFPA